MNKEEIFEEVWGFVEWLEWDTLRWVKSYSDKLAEVEREYGIYNEMSLFEELFPLGYILPKAGFDPNQPRVPAGNPDGGQWTDSGGGGFFSGAGSAKQYVAIVQKIPIYQYIK